MKCVAEASGEEENEMMNACRGFCSSKPEMADYFTWL
jgi:hypothetical protein